MTTESGHAGPGSRTEIYRQARNLLQELGRDYAKAV